MTLRAGPRFVAGSSDPLLDLNLSLSWPFDLSGARSARTALADAATEAAEAEVADAQRLSTGRALDLWVRARGAAEGVRLAEARLALATLRAADDAVGLTERLATRAYDLGQRDLASVLVARRSAAEARQRRLETLVALGRARVAVDQAAGRSP